VMSGGKLQQLGPPQEVYDHPVNLFVAGFIGSPPMNLFAGQVRDGTVSAGDLVFQRSGVPDGAAIVGIRPEAMTVGGAEGMRTKVQVDVVEPLGDEVIVHGTVDARAAESGAEEEAALLVTTDGARAPVSLRVDPAAAPRVGEDLPIGIDPAKVHLFDATSGIAIA